MRDIAALLNTEGIPAPKRTKNPTKMVPAQGWLQDTIGGYLSNIAYVGQTWSGSKAKKQGEIIRTSWAPIISDALFKRVQDRLSKFRAPIAKGKIRRSREFVFRGLLWCVECDRRFASQFSHGQVYYYCGSRETASPCDHGKHAILRSNSCRGWMTSSPASSLAEWVGCTSARSR